MILKKVHTAASIAVVFIMTVSSTVSAFAAGHGIVSVAAAVEPCAHVQFSMETSTAFTEWSDVVPDACSTMCNAASFQLAQARYEDNADDIDAGAQKYNCSFWSLARHFSPRLFDQTNVVAKLPTYLLTLRFHL